MDSESGSKAMNWGALLEISKSPNSVSIPDQPVIGIDSTVSTYGWHPRMIRIGRRYDGRDRILKGKRRFGHEPIARLAFVSRPTSLWCRSCRSEREGRGHLMCHTKVATCADQPSEVVQSDDHACSACRLYSSIAAIVVRSSTLSSGMAESSKVSASP